MNINRILIKIILSFLSIILINKLVIKIFINKKAHYFILHSIVNFYIITLTYKDTIDCFLYPLNAFENKFIDNFETSNIIIFSFHVFHLINEYKKLSFEDIIHHLINGIFTTSLGMFYPWGKIGSINNICTNSTE